VALVACTALIGFLINAGYYYWHGGYAIGPRHLVAYLPLIVVALAFVDLPTMTDKIVAGALATAGLIFSVMCAEVTRFAPNDYFVPIRDLILPRFLDPAELIHATPIIVIWSGFVWLLLQPAGKLSLSAPLQRASASAHRVRR
jgi:hypothetical protein